MYQVILQKIAERTSRTLGSWRNLAHAFGMEILSLKTDGLLPNIEPEFLEKVQELGVVNLHGNNERGRCFDKLN